MHALASTVKSKLHHSPKSPSKNPSKATGTTATTTTMAGTSLKDKIAVVTGASRGIGRQTAIALAAEGATVVVNYLSSAGPAEEVVKQIGANHATAIQADISSVAGGEKLVDEVVKKYGRIDILVCNAGLLVQNGSLEDTTEENFDRVMGANVKGVFFLVKVSDSREL